MTSGTIDAAPPTVPTPAAGAADRYDAFISYSHAADGALAPALRNGLQRFATPWRVLRFTNPTRSLRVFQDQASLSAESEVVADDRECAGKLDVVHPPRVARGGGVAVGRRRKSSSGVSTSRSTSS